MLAAERIEFYHRTLGHPSSRGLLTRKGALPTGRSKAGIANGHLRAFDSGLHDTRSTPGVSVSMNVDLEASAARVMVTQVAACDEPPELDAFALAKRHGWLDGDLGFADGGQLEVQPFFHLPLAAEPCGPFRRSLQPLAQVNSIRIVLDAGTDTYTLEFHKIGRAPRFTSKLVATVDRVYVDSFHRVIESNTGLATRL